VRAARNFCATVLLIVAVGSSAAAAVENAASIRTKIGELKGTRYRIDMPKRWHGGLVVYFHGYEVPGEPRPASLPLGAVGAALVERGYALIQSEYSQQGWAARQALDETEQLRVLFERQYGRPTHRLAVGGSFGGLLALASAEARPHVYGGVLTTCGLNAPPLQFFEHVFDVLVGFDTLFPGILPTNGRGLDVPDAPLMLSDAAAKAIETALAGDPARAAILARRSEASIESLPGKIWVYWAALRDVRHRAGGLPLGNAARRYTGWGDDDRFNREVRRYSANPSSARWLAKHPKLTGRVNSPVVALANTQDELVPPSFQPVYQQLARLRGSAALVTQLPSVGEGHCAFKTDEVLSAFETLRAQASGTSQARR
jgi:pimeloyl-ACP methyl ester carboxylesterase